MLTTNIRSLAEYNLAQEPRLSLAKDQLGRVYENAVEYQKKYDESKQKLGINMVMYSIYGEHCRLS